MKVEYVRHMGDDRAIADAARASHESTSDEYSDEQVIRLLGYLARGVPSSKWKELIEEAKIGDTEEVLKYVRSIPTHWVPFAHGVVTLKMKAPVSIRTQCFKHKQGLVESEESRRYITSTPEYYIPRFFRESAANVKQGSTDKPVDNNEAWLETYKNHMEDSIALYEAAIKDGMCAEQARFLLPQGVKVNWIWTGSLYAYANFFIQRTDPHAQAEIQELAYKVGNIIEPLFPESWKALTQ